MLAGSGCAALIYEIVWFQLLQLVIGSSAISLGLLLAAYMGGLCLGSVLLPRMISPRYHPLRVYALLELGIGLFGLLALWGVPLVGRMYVAGASEGMLGLLLRGVVAAICLLPPTVLMGASLPAISRWMETTPQGVSWLGYLYSSNIAGAVFGCLLAGFYLLRVYDMAVTTYVAAGVNLAIALLAFVSAARVNHSAARPIPPGDRARRQEGALLVYVAIGLSGLTRVGSRGGLDAALSLLLGATVYTFSIILAVFLIGLWAGSSTGSSLARRIQRPRSLWRAANSAGASDRLDRLYAGAFTALLAGRPMAFARSVVQLRTRPRALRVGYFPSHRAVGRKFSFGAGGRGRSGRGPGRAVRGSLRHEYSRFDRWRAGFQPGAHSRAGNARIATAIDRLAVRRRPGCRPAVRWLPAGRLAGAGRWLVHRCAGWRAGVTVSKCPGKWSLMDAESRRSCAPSICSTGNPTKSLSAAKESILLCLIAERAVSGTST